MKTKINRKLKQKMENETYYKENFKGDSPNSGGSQRDNINSYKPGVNFPQPLVGPREMLNESLFMFKSRFKTLLGVALIPSLVIILLFILFGVIGFFSLSFGSSIVNYLLIIVVCFLFVAVIVLQFWGRAALIYAIKDGGENIGIKESFRRGRVKIRQFFWVSILTGLVTMGGLLLFGIPGIIFSVWFSFAIFIVIEEDLRGMNVLLKSREYVRGYWWSVWWRNLYLGGILMVIGLAFTFFEGLFSFLNLQALGELVNLVNVVVSIILTPLATIYQFIIYKNLKEIKGDFAFSPSRGFKIKLLIISIIGVVWGVLMLIALFPFINNYGDNLDKESKAYVDMVVPAIVGSWEPQELISRASPELLKSNSDDALKFYFKASFNKYGRLKEYRGSTGQAIINPGEETKANYSAKADFEKGSATIWINVIKIKNKWQISVFQVVSDTLLNSKEIEKQNKYYADINEVKNLWSAGKYQEALDKASGALLNAQIDKEKAIAHYWIGLSQYKLQNYAVAELELKLAIELDKNYAAPYVTLAAIEMDSKGNFSKALEYAEKCVSLDPKYAWCYNSKGLALYQLGQKDEGIKSLEQAVSLSPESFVFRDNLTRAKQTIGQSITEENSVPIDQNDAKRKADLVIISALLQNYKNINGEYPISPSLAKLNQNNNEVVGKMKSVSSSVVIPIDPKLGNYYGYTSVDGKSFELTAQLENLNDPDCDQDLKINKNVCIYKLKSDL